MWVLLLLLLLSNNKLYAQEQQILSGVVKDANGIPLEGVTVWQKDTNNGTQTNEQGFYSLQIVPQTAVTFEYLGYKTQTLKVTGKILNVTLITDDDVLDEVVINAGYYTVKDKERTGSISKITSKEISQQPVANPLAAMQGRMAGVNITQSSGTPGGGFDIQIRGRNSLRTEGNAPLYIVDGVPFLSESTSSADLAVEILRNTSNNPLQLINPNDIESIEVLKDADATAIYGSRGANGVVLITTKKGNGQPTVFSLQSYTAVGTVPKFMKLLNTEQYIQLRQFAFANDGITEYPANAYDVNGTWDQNRYTNWQKELIGGNAVSQQVSANVRGGDKFNQFMVQASTAKDGTVFPGDYGNARKNILAQFSHSTSNDKWKVQIQFVRGESNNSLIGVDLTRDALTLSPNAPALYDDRGNLNWANNTWNNPLRWKNQEYIAKNTQWLTALDIEGKLSNAFTLRMQTGYNESNGEEWKIMPHTIYNPAMGLTSANSSSMFGDALGKVWNLEPQLHFKKMIDKHQVTALIGTTFLKQENSRQMWLASNFGSNAEIQNLMAAKTLRLLNNVANKYAYQAVFTRFNYQYNDKYILNITSRRDGSSRFGPNKRWGTFAAVGAAWLFSREKFFSESSWLSFGKLRASYGTSGSDRIGDYQYLDTYGYSGGTYETGGIKPMRLYNPNFSWEKNLKKEVALEMALFNSRVNFSVAYYLNISSNQLVGIPLPGTTGFSSVQANLGAEVENSGWEFQINTRAVQKNDYSLELYGNLSLNRNRLIKFPNLEGSTYKNIYALGYSTSIAMAYEITGIDSETGLYTFRDVNEDGILNANDDKKAIIDRSPKFIAGFGYDLVVKNWSLSMLFHAVKQLGVNPLLSFGMPGSLTNQPKDYDVQPMQFPSAGYNNNSAAAYSRFTQSDAAYTDASYVRLKNMTVNYKIPQIFSSKLSGNIYVSGQNIFTWTKYKGLDPESQGISALPPLRVWSLGFVLNY